MAKAVNKGKKPAPVKKKEKKEKVEMVIVLIHGVLRIMNILMKKTKYVVFNLV